ncbi:MAG: hypothetical protein ACR2PR_06170 [Pseudohongiellaceae bacterium]
MNGDENTTDSQAERDLVARRNPWPHPPNGKPYQPMNTEKTEDEPSMMASILFAIAFFFVLIAIEQLPLLHLLVVVGGIFFLFILGITLFFCGFLGAIVDFIRNR